MRVKTIAILSTLLALVWSCSARSSETPLPSSVLEFPSPRVGRTVTLQETGGRLTAIYADWESTALAVSELSAVDPLPPHPPPWSLADRLDAGAALTDGFGEHASALTADGITMLYDGRGRDGKRILKVVSRTGAGGWLVDVVEPSGRPVAVVPSPAESGGKGYPALFWATDSLLARTSAAEQPRTILSPFTPASPGCVVGNGFTVFDLISKKLLYFSVDDSLPGGKEIPGGQPIHWSTLSASGQLAVATFDASRKRIILVEEAPDGARFRSKTVTLCDGTHSVFCAPFGGGFIFLYDAMEREGRGGTAFPLYLLVPRDSGYRRYLLLQGEAPITGFSAVLAGRTLNVLAAGKTLKLVRCELP